MYQGWANHSAMRREVLSPTRDLQSGKSVAKQYDYEYDHDFEFQISWTSDADEELSPSENSNSQLQPSHEKLRARGKSLPTMAFADELFCDGKVMPLRPPPRFYTGNRSWNPSPDASPPRSPYPASRLQLPRKKIWNDDFDPFTAALEKVKQEDRGRTQVSNHRRAQSLSPFWALKSRSAGRTSSDDHDQDQRTPDKDIKTDHERNRVNAEISKKHQGLKRLFSFASFGSSSSCLRPQIYHQLHTQGQKPPKKKMTTRTTTTVLH